MVHFIFVRPIPLVIVHHYYVCAIVVIMLLMYLLLLVHVVSDWQIHIFLKIEMRHNYSTLPEPMLTYGTICTSTIQCQTSLACIFSD